MAVAGRETAPGGLEPALGIDREQGGICSGEESLARFPSLKVGEPDADVDRLLFQHGSDLVETAAGFDDVGRSKRAHELVPP